MDIDIDDAKDSYQRFSLPAARVPQSLVFTAARFSAGREIRAAYVESESTDDATQYVLYWLTDSEFGVVEGKAPRDWDGNMKLADEPITDRQISVSLYRLRDLTRITCTNPDVTFQDWGQTHDVRVSIRAHFGHGATVQFPEFGWPSHSGQRVLIDQFVDALRSAW